MNEGEDSGRRTGFASAFGAYTIWGFFPLYLLLVVAVPPIEFVAWRILWTLPVCLAIVMVRRQWPQVKAALADPVSRRWLLFSSLLISINWFVYVWAIQTGHIYAASLGYYINPLVNVLLGTLLLGEKLSRGQWLAVALAAIGVALLATGALTTLWISLTLALSFGSYGLVRKRITVGSLPGLTVETAVLFLPCLAIAWWYAADAGSAFLREPGLSLAIAAGGPITAIPLLMFAIAARRLPYSTLGFVQFLAPSIVFILGLTVFDKPLRPVEVACFGFIWAAAAIFVWDLWQRNRARAPRPAGPL